MLTFDPLSSVIIHPQTDFVVMSMSGGGGGRDMRMDSTLPTVDADGKESADNDTNGNLAGSPNNVITRSNGNAGTQIPPRPRQLPQLDSNATNVFAGAPVHLRQPPGLPSAAADRDSVDETPISPTSIRAPREECGRPQVRLPPQIPAEDPVSSTSIRAPQYEEPHGRPMVRLPPQINTEDRSFTIVTTESPVGQSTLSLDQAIRNEAATEAINALSTLIDDSLNSQPQEPTPNLQVQGISSADFAANPVPVDRSSLSPPNEPNLDQQARSIPSSDSGASMLRLPRPARFLLPSDLSSAVSTPPTRQLVDVDRLFQSTQNVRGNGLGAGVASPLRQDPVRGQPPMRGQPSLRGQAPLHRPGPIRTRPTAGSLAHVHPMQRRSPAQGQGPVQNQVPESTATSLAPTPPPQLTDFQQCTQRQMTFNRLRSQQIFIAQRVRIKFAPPTHSTVRIQQQFALMQQQAMQRNRRHSLQFAETNNAGYMPVRTAETRREQMAALDSQSREMEYRMRSHFGESWQQGLARQERLNSVIHARELRHRLSILDLRNYTPGCMKGRSEASSAPGSPPTGPSGAHDSNRQPPLNGERQPYTWRRSDSSSPVKTDWGRTPAPVIANGRTLEQRLRDPLPDVREWHPALNGNPAGFRPRSLTEGAASPGECLRPLAYDGNDDEFSILRCPREGEAGPSTWAQSGSQTERDDASSSTMYEAQPADLPLPASSDEGDGSANEHESAPHIASSLTEDAARPENCPLPESSDDDNYVPLVRHGSAPPVHPLLTSSDEEIPGPSTSHSPRINEAGTRDHTQPECYDRERPTNPTAYSPKEGEAGPSDRSQSGPTSHSPQEGEAESSRRSRPCTREAIQTPSLPAPRNPFYRGDVTLHRCNSGPLRIITPVAAYVPGDTDLPIPPPRTAQQERRVDEHERIVDLGSSDREGSDRVIASSSSEDSVGDENRDGDDEDSESDPVVAKEEK
jgi:hypothetical protein